jgi:hypothetical protein
MRTVAMYIPHACSPSTMLMMMLTEAMAMLVDAIAVTTPGRRRGDCLA